MDYFIELLESYSKLKKRKLKLLIESSDPESLAKAELSAAQGMNPPPTTSSPYVGNGVRAQVAIFSTPKGWKFAPLASDGRPNVGASKFIDKDYATFVGYFGDSEGGQLDTGQPQKKEKAKGGENIMGSELFEVYPEDLSDVVEIFANIELMTPEIFSGINKKLMKNKKWSSPAQFATYLFGRRKGSLESSIINLRTKISFDPNTKTYVTSKVPSSPTTLKNVSKNLQTLLEAISKDKIDDSKIKRIIESSIVFNDDDTVSIFEDIEGSGLVFSDNSGFLKFLLSSVMEKHNIKIRKVKVSKTISTGFDNVTRGVAMEKVLPVFSLLKRKAALEALGHPGSRDLDKMIKQAFSEVEEKLNLLSKSFQGWVKDFDESAMDPEDAQILRDCGSLLGKDGSKLITAMYKASKDAIAIRNPDFILTKGEETGEGRRQDTLELFNSFDKAKKALINMGYTEEEIALNNMIKKGPLDLIFSGKEDTLKLASKAKIFENNKEAFYVSVSLKNYIELDEAVFGTTTVGSNRNYIQGNSQDPENKFLKKYQEITGQTSEQYEAVKSYDQALYDIGGKIREIPIKAKTRNKSTGNLKDVSPFSDFVDSCLDTIKSNSTYDELSNPLNNDSKDKKDLYDLINRYKDSVDEDDDKSNLEDKIKQYSTTLLKNKKLIADINRGDETAKQYLAMKLFNTGGCVDDGLMCDYRGLGNGKKYSFNQNTVVKDVMNSFLKGDGEWGLRATGNNFIFFNTKNPKMKFMITDKVEKRAGVSGEYYSTKTSCVINNQVMEHYTKNRQLASTMESLIAYHKEFLEKLTLLNEKVVIG